METQEPASTTPKKHTCKCKRQEKASYNTEPGEEGFDDLDENTYSLVQRGFAGGIAGVAEHMVMFPSDKIKLNSQMGVTYESLGIRSDTARHFSSDLTKFWFTQKAWQGVAFNMNMVGVAHALQFPVIEVVSKSLNNSFLGGAAGAVFHDIIMTPANLIKQRRQYCHSPYKDSIHCAKTVLRNEGVVAFYRPFPSQVALSMLFMGTYNNVANDRLKKSLGDRVKFLNNDQHPILNFLVRSAIGTTLATTVTQPIDAVCTRVNMQYSKSIGVSVSNCPSTCEKLNACANSAAAATSSSTSTSSSAAQRPAPSPSFIKLSKANYHNNHRAGLRPPGFESSSSILSRSQFNQKVTIGSALRDIWCKGDSFRDQLRNGVRESYKGYQWRLLACLPSNAITWGTYESIKYGMTRYGCAADRRF